MTRQPPLIEPSRQIPPDRRPRLCFKPIAAATGYVDGAWWPHGDDLRVELPDLLAVLVDRLGPVHRVIYHLGEWVTAPSGLDRRVRLDGYRHQPAHTLEVRGISGSKITLLVVPPQTDANAAGMILRIAAHPENASTVDDLLAITA